MARATKKSQKKEGSHAKHSLSTFGLPSKPHRKSQKRLFVQIVIALLLLVVLFLIFELLIENGYIENPFGDLAFNNEVQQFSVPDSCSIIAGQLIHTLLGEGECEVRCKQDCELRDLSYYDYEFTERLGDCHICDCYCR